MTDQDNLRYRIEYVLHRTAGSDWHETAQAIIDELGLTVETEPGKRGINPVQRIVGKWERND